MFHRCFSCLSILLEMRREYKAIKYAKSKVEPLLTFYRGGVWREPLNTVQCTLQIGPVLLIVCARPVVLFIYLTVCISHQNLPESFDGLQIRERMITRRGEVTNRYKM